jgi:hypothetical protein
MVEVLLYYLNMGDYVATFLQIVFMILFVYMMIRISCCLADIYFWKDKHARENLYTMSGIFLRVIALFIFIAVVYGYLLYHLIYTDFADAVVAENNALLMKVDQMLFGVHLPFWLQGPSNMFSGFLGDYNEMIYRIYGSLGTTMALFLLFTLVVNGRVFVHLFTTFLLSFLISIPLWHAFPAMSPVVAYFDPVIDPVPYSKEIRVTLDEYAPNSNLEEYLSERVVNDRELIHEYKNITAMPSMHGAWGAAIALFMVVLWRPLIIIAIPYFLLNFFSSIYSLQHYAVDILAGTFITLFAFICTTKMHTTVWMRDLMLVHSMILRDVKAILSIFRFSKSGRSS